MLSPERVRFAYIDGNAVLLDVAGGNYLVLTATETAMWQALTELTPQQRLDALVEQFDAPRAVIAADLVVFERLCLEKGYLTDHPPPARKAARVTVRSGDGAGAAWMWMLRISLALRRSFKDAYDLCQNLPKPPRAEPPGGLVQAEGAFLRAENFFMFRRAPKDCLPRSLSLYCFLTSAGFDVTHVIGVSRYPFEAHAWVERNGDVLLDRSEWVGKYASLARI